MAEIDEALAANLPVKPGTCIAGKYRVERLLAVGGMGAVVVAFHEVLDKQVAIKFMRPELLENQEAVQRFLREAQATARIKSDYVARVLDIDTLDDGTPFIVMEYLLGRPLDVVLEEDTDIDVSFAVDMVMEALTGLAVAHDAGVVHRDLKPSNIFITSLPDGRPRVKLLDFGIAKVLQPEGASDVGALTGTKQILGSPQYMSPEQIMSAKNVDVRSDLWSIGVILHEMLSGIPAFNGENVGSVLAQILTEEPPRLDDVRDDIEPDLADVVVQALARERDDRFATAHDMMRALSSHASTRARNSLLLSLPPPGLGPQQCAPKLDIRNPAPVSVGLADVDCLGVTSHAMKPAPLPELVQDSRDPSHLGLGEVGQLDLPVVEPTTAAPVARDSPTPPAPRSGSSFAWLLVAMMVLASASGALLLLNRVRTPAASGSALVQPSPVLEPSLVLAKSVEARTLSSSATTSTPPISASVRAVSPSAALKPPAAPVAASKPWGHRSARPQAASSAAPEPSAKKTPPTEPDHLRYRD